MSASNKYEQLLLFTHIKTSQLTDPFSTGHYKNQEAVYAVISVVQVYFRDNSIHVLLSNKVFLKVCIFCPPETTSLAGLLWKCKSCILSA